MTTITPQETLFSAHLELAGKIAGSFPVPRMTLAERLHEARIALWNAALNFNPDKGSFEAFATIVIRNHLRNVFNKAKRDDAKLIDPLAILADAHDEETSSEAIFDPHPSPLSEAERADIRAAVQREIDALTKEQREVLQTYADGSSFSAIAQERGVSKAAVRQMSQRAIEQIRPNLQSKQIGPQFSLGQPPQDRSSSDLSQPFHQANLIREIRLRKRLAKRRMVLFIGLLVLIGVFLLIRFGN